MNLELKADIAAAVLKGEVLSPPKGSVLLSSIQQASSPHDLLHCLAEIGNSSSIDEGIAASIERLLPSGLIGQTAEILAQVCAAEENPEICRRLFEEAAAVQDVRGLVRLIIKVRTRNLSKAESPHDDGEDHLHTDHPEVESAFFRRPKCVHSGMCVHGMFHDRVASGEYCDSPAKDVARSAWRSRLLDGLGGVSDEQRGRMKVFSLLGREARDLPIYHDLLGIPYDQIYAAEFDESTYRSMVEHDVPFHVNPGNCVDFAVNHPDLRYNIMNLDLCGPLHEFFLTGENKILSRCAEDCEISINSRIRQDTIALQGAETFILQLTFLKLLPEISSVMKRLWASKKHLFSDENVAYHMALREIYFIWELIKNMEGKHLDCCRGDAAIYSDFFSRQSLLLQKVMDDEKRRENFFRNGVSKGMREITTAALKENLRFSRIAETPTGKRVLLASMRRAIYRRSDFIELFEESGCFEDFSSIVKDLMGLETIEEGDVLAKRLQAEMPGTRKERRDETLFKRLNARAYRFCLAQHYMSQRLAGIERLTYSSNVTSTMQTWFFRFEPLLEPRTRIEVLIDALTQLMNAGDTYVTKEGLVKSVQPDGETPHTIECAPGRVLDFHRDGAGHSQSGNYGSRITKKDRDMRRRHREMANAARKLNRE